MEKNNIILFLSMLLVFSYSQLSEKSSPINYPRKLDENEAKTILLGFDNYTSIYYYGFNNFSLSFYTYFLLKNWNHSYYINDLETNYFPIDAIINDTDKKQFAANFNCTFTFDNDNYERINEQYYIIRYICSSNPILNGGRPKIINFTTDFSKEIIEINGSESYDVSPSVQVFKKDFLNLKNKTIINMKNIEIIKNTTFISQNPSSFKLKGKGYRYNSYNILLFTNSHSEPRKVPCKGEYKMDSNDDYYYFLESKGSNNLNSASLKYAVANFTTDKKETLIIDFQEGAKYQIEEGKTFSKKSSGGLSTGGIVGVVIPSCVVLLGAAGLAFFLSRRAIPSPPMNNFANKTIGVASSEAVVHQ